MPTKIYWVSRHELSDDQILAVKSLFGNDCEIEYKPIIFKSPQGLAEFIDEHEDGKVLVVAGALHYLVAMNMGKSFFFFEREEDRSFGSIWRVNEVSSLGDLIQQNRIEKVWSRGYLQRGHKKEIKNG